ncbi:hypothetical protein RHMOL_Rhmol05G0192600 [Rhododendron molle]|uniref:Uncharacterized protein n=1 Tax=Rhododendron molle TaxID=49168 RepID=A0ACC0NT73_RHOML|nr:hypothetical protein RHMOL_Rhmol05G0192600 [Rhododendron molle]
MCSVWFNNASLIQNLWCIANAAKIRELPIAPVPQLAMPTPNEDSEDDITKIANLPMSVEKVLHALKFPLMLFFNHDRRCNWKHRSSSIFRGCSRSLQKFNVHSMSAKDIVEPIDRSEELLALPSNTPNKKSKRSDHESSSSTSAPTTDETPNSPNNNN